MMDKGILAAFATASALLVGACARTHTVGTSPTTLDDAQVLGALITLHEGEVETARIAGDKASHEAVRSFAHRVQTEHEAAIERIRALSSELGIVPTESRLADALESEAEREGERLDEAEGARFDHAYVDMQAEGHRELLATFDRTIAPAVTHPRIREEVEQQRAALAAHLDHARHLEHHLEHLDAHLMD